MRIFFPGIRFAVGAAPVLLCVLASRWSDAKQSPAGHFTNGAFDIRASRIDTQARTGLLMLDGDVEVRPLRPDVRLKIGSARHTLELGQETEEPPYRLPLAVVPFDTASQTVEVLGGATIFRDKRGRSLTVHANPAPG